VFKQFSKHIDEAVKLISFGSAEVESPEQASTGIGHSLPMTREMLNELLDRTPSLPTTHAERHLVEEVEHEEKELVLV